MGRRPAPSQDPVLRESTRSASRSATSWNDVPLFREIQRVLLSSSGP